MKRNDFQRDNAWQQAIRDRVLAPFYGEHSRDGRYVFIDKGRWATLVQKRMAVDTVLQSAKHGGAIAIEEKIARPLRNGRRRDMFCLETQSCTNPDFESNGWMVYGEADYLFYCFVQHDDAIDGYMIDFQALKKWFWLHAAQYKLFTMVDTINRTQGRLVPIHDVCNAVPTFRVALAKPELFIW